MNQLTIIAAAMLIAMMMISFSYVNAPVPNTDTTEYGVKK